MYALVDLEAQHINSYSFDMRCLACGVLTLALQTFHCVTAVDWKLVFGRFQYKLRNCVLWV